MSCPFFTEAFTQLLWNLDQFSLVFAFDGSLDPSTSLGTGLARDKLGVQFIHLDRLERLIEVFQVQAMEIGGPFTGSFQQTLDAARIDFTDVCRRFHRTAMGEAFDNAHHGRFGQLGVLHEGTLAFTKACAAGLAVQPTNALAFAHPFNHGEIASIEAIEIGTVAVGAGKEG